MGAREANLIRYAVVGLGHIAQVAMLPAFAHAKRNSRLVAVVKDDPAKRKAVSRTYQLDSAFSYDDYDARLELVDAYLFRTEPAEVMAISVNRGTAKLDEVDESTGALLRFDGGRVAAFVTSFNATDVAS